MAEAVRGIQAVKVYLEMIKIEHSIFALPFAMIGMIWGATAAGKGLWPGLSVFLWIVVAMVSCRASAMAFNRIADRAIDADNPRTAIRALPAGLLSLRTANLLLLVTIALFVLSAAMLNSLALQLSPIALLVTLGYSLTKRFTWLCHWVLGFSLGIAPGAAYLAVAGVLDPAILAVVFAVMFWTAGFDLIYALQDDQFDREHKLHSFPARFGRKVSLAMSRVCHGLALILLAWAGAMHGAGWWWFGGVAAVACLLAYEQSLVRPDDLSKVNLAFFTLNGYVSLGMFGFALLDGILSR